MQQETKTKQNAKIQYCQQGEKKENIENLYVAVDDIMITKIYNFRFLLI